MATPHPNAWATLFLTMCCLGPSACRTGDALRDFPPPDDPSVAPIVTEEIGVAPVDVRPHFAIEVGDEGKSRAMLGTMFAIDPDHLFTAKHVYDLSFEPVERGWGDPEDWVLIEMPGHGLDPPAVASAARPALGTEVYVHGFIGRPARRRIIRGTVAEAPVGLSSEYYPVPDNFVLLRVQGLSMQSLHGTVWGSGLSRRRHRLRLRACGPGTHRLGRR